MQDTVLDPVHQPGLGILAAAVRRRLKQVISARLAVHGITLQQFWVILVLGESGGTSLHPLAQRVWMDDPTASRVVKSLVERGLVTTQPDPHHGRRILISLAPGALPLAQELQALAAEVKAGLVCGLSADQQAVLRQGLRDMIANLDAMLMESAPAAAD